MARFSLSTLKYAEGSRKRSRRIGRGQGSSRGGTSTRGHKGAKSRSGAKHRPWFEGGQMPLIRRVPKFGFHSPFRVEYQIVNIGTLAAMAKAGKFKDGSVTVDALYNLGAISKKTLPVKVLGSGELTTKLSVTVHAFSASAKQKIESAGGTATLIANQS